MGRKRQRSRKNQPRPTTIYLPDSSGDPEIDRKNEEFVRSLAEATTKTNSVYEALSLAMAQDLLKGKKTSDEKVKAKQMELLDVLRMVG